MNDEIMNPSCLDHAGRQFYRDGMTLLQQAGIPFLVGGAYALTYYTGIQRHTKDLDVFVAKKDFEATIAAFAKGGFPSRIEDPNWLGKAFHHDEFIDVIYRSGNGLAPVDDEWFRYAMPASVMGVDVLITPAEESIWSKAFTMERERYDGADIAHLLLATGEMLDWDRLLRRFGDQWRVLLSHLVLFGFIYPDHRDRIPQSVLGELTARLVGDARSCSKERAGLCLGPLLSRAQYRIDTGHWGYQDGRGLIPDFEISKAL